MSSIWTSSIKSTPGITSALFSSCHSAIFWSIWSLTSYLISPVSPENKAMNPWAHELITSISCKLTVWTVSFFLKISPSGHWANLVYGETASYSLALAKLLPCFVTFPDTLSTVIMSPAVTFSFMSPSIIFEPRSYTDSMSVVLRVSLPVFSLLAPFSNSIWTTSPSMTSDSSLIHTAMDLLKAYVRLSVLLISKEKISEPEIMLKGVSCPKDLARPKARAVFPVPGWPPIRTAQPAIFPSLTIL